MEPSTSGAALSQLVEAIEKIAPPGYAEAWDNAGLLVGDRGQRVSKAMLTIDYTSAVAREGEAAEVQAIIAYHPPIFAPLKRIEAGGVIHDAIRRGVAIYSPHTALDATVGGTNDVLCDVLGVKEDRRPLRAQAAANDELKLVVFVPTDHVEAVSRAMFDAGAGRIGDYSSCSFRIPGTGTFFGEAGSDPALGEAGKLEQVSELRIESIVRQADVPAVVSAVRAAHPYEEVAIDLVPLARVPRAIGQGRSGRLPEPVQREQLLQRIKRELRLEHLLIAGPVSGSVDRVAVCAGSGGGEMLDAAIAARAQLYLTGEVRHHDALRAAAAGMTAICTLHSNSERITLERLRSQLAAALPAVEFVVSSADRDPFEIRCERA